MDPHIFWVEKYDSARFLVGEHESASFFDMNPRVFYVEKHDSARFFGVENYESARVWGRKT